MTEQNNSNIRNMIDLLDMLDTMRRMAGELPNVILTDIHIIKPTGDTE